MRGKFLNVVDFFGILNEGKFPPWLCAISLVQSVEIIVDGVYIKNHIIVRISNIFFTWHKLLSVGNGLLYVIVELVFYSSLGLREYESLIIVVVVCETHNLLGILHEMPCFL